MTQPESLLESQAATQSLLTEPGVIVGTVPYLSPEQVRGETVDARSDIFSFGAVLYEMVSGTRPFGCESAATTISAVLTLEPPPLARFAREVPAELERIVTKALRKDREQRYQSMKDLLLDLRSLKQELEFEAHSSRSSDRAESGARTVVMQLSKGGAEAASSADGKQAVLTKAAPRISGIKLLPAAMVTAVLLIAVVG